jgi:hypothetical protein
MDEYATALTLDIAIRVRDRHGVQLNGVCGHCPNTVWPCQAFVLSHSVILRLTQPKSDEDS